MLDTPFVNMIQIYGSVSEVFMNSISTYGTISWLGYAKNWLSWTYNLIAVRGLYVESYPLSYISYLFCL